MSLIPPGNRTLLKLIIEIVELKHGKDAIAKQTIQKSKKGLVVIRAGEEIPIEEDDKRWNDAREAVLNAILDEKLNAYVSSEDGQKMHITSDEWEILENSKWEDHNAEATLSTGNLSWLAKPAFNGQPVYFGDNKAKKFLDTLTKDKDSLRDKFIFKATKILKKNPHLQAPKLLQYSSLQTLTRGSNISTNHIKKKWIPKARELAGVKGMSRKGAPRKT